MDVISDDFYDFSDITFSIQSSLATLICLDTLQSLQSESRADAGEVKAFKLIMVYQEFSFLNNFTTLGWQEQNTTLCTKTT